MEEPFLSWDILCFELPNAYYETYYLAAFVMLRRSSYVCKRMHTTWKKQVRNIPFRYLLNINEETLKEFTRLEEISYEVCNVRYNSEYLTSLRSLKKLILPGLAKEQFLDSTLSKLTSLTSLSLHGNYETSDDGLKTLTSLTSLDLPEYSSAISDSSISRLTNLRCLNIRGCINITDHGISTLTNLESIYLGMNKNITPAGIKKMSKLTEIYPEYNYRFY